MQLFSKPLLGPGLALTCPCHLETWGQVWTAPHGGPNLKLVLQNSSPHLRSCPRPPPISTSLQLFHASTPPSTNAWPGASGVLVREQVSRRKSPKPLVMAPAHVLWGQG